MTIPAVLNISREEFLDEWRVALVDLTEDEARDYVVHLQQKMTDMALHHRTAQP